MYLESKTKRIFATACLGKKVGFSYGILRISRYILYLVIYLVFVVLFVLENCVIAVFLPHCISTPIVHFSNSATAGPKPGMKKEQGRTTKIILGNLKKVRF